MKRLAILLPAILGCVASASGEPRDVPQQMTTQPVDEARQADEIHRKALELVGPVQPVKAAIFNASRATYAKVCGGVHPAEGVASGISRLEFAAATPAQQASITDVMGQQARSNISIWQSLADDPARRSFCRGLDVAIADYAAAFVKRHPILFQTKQRPRPLPSASDRQINVPNTDPSEARISHMLATAPTSLDFRPVYGPTQPAPQFPGQPKSGWEDLYTPLRDAR